MGPESNHSTTRSIRRKASLLHCAASRRTRRYRGDGVVMTQPVETKPSQTISCPDDQIYYAYRSVSRVNGSIYYDHPSPSEWWVGLFGFKDPIVQVRIRERRDGDPESRYWGWLDTDKPDHY